MPQNHLQLLLSHALESLAALESRLIADLDSPDSIEVVKAAVADTATDITAKHEELVTAAQQPAVDTAPVDAATDNTDVVKQD